MTYEQQQAYLAELEEEQQESNRMSGIEKEMHMARPNGRFCGAKRPKCEAEQPLGFD